MNQRMMIWLAILFSTFIYLFIAMVMSGEPATFEQLSRSTFVRILYGAALLAFLFGWFVAPRVIKGPPQTTMIVALAVFESCAIFGLVTAFLTQDWRTYLLPWALALAGFMKERPRE